MRGIWRFEDSWHLCNICHLVPALHWIRKGGTWYQRIILCLLALQYMYYFHVCFVYHNKNWILKMSLPISSRVYLPLQVGQQCFGCTTGWVQGTSHSTRSHFWIPSSQEHTWQTSFGCTHFWPCAIDCPTLFWQPETEQNRIIEIIWEQNYYNYKYYSGMLKNLIILHWFAICYKGKDTVESNFHQDVFIFIARV